jgi:hypothetical protein
VNVINGQQCPSVVCQSKGAIFTYHDGLSWADCDDLPARIIAALPEGERDRCERHRIRRLGDASMPSTANVATPDRRFSALRLACCRLALLLMAACGEPRPSPQAENPARPADGWAVYLVSFADLHRQFPHLPAANSVTDHEAKAIWIGLPTWVADDPALRRAVRNAIATSWHELGHQVERAYPDIWRRHLAAFDDPVRFRIITDEQRRDGMLP